MSHSFNRIPSEMQFYRQWVTWRYEENDKPGGKPTKVLFNPLFNGHASVDKPETWVSYNEAVKAFEDNPTHWSGIGFVLSVNDPYCFIDLDSTDGFSNAEELFARQNAIFKATQSYVEWSPSGQGLHIICKGSVERGRKRAQIEIYSQSRFMTMTGNVLRDTPIVNEDTFVKMLWHEMGGAASVHSRMVTFAEQSEDDAIVLNRMFTAENGVKARDIYEGYWDKHVGSHSEADQALFNMLVFYTKNKEQIIRLFQASALGKRKKAYRVDYLDRSICLAFDRELPPVDTEGLLIALENVRIAQMNSPAPEGPNAGLNGDGGGDPREEPSKVETVDRCSTAPGAHIQPRNAPVNASIAIPPGLVGDIAAFIYSASPRPVAEASLVAAIGLVAGIAGRAYNISGSGLNQYLMFLARTGTGKEAINNGISKIMHACVAGGSPRAMDFIGPGQIRSDAALLKWLDRQQSFVSIVGEFGMRLKRMSHENAPDHVANLLALMLDVYTKSGANQTLNPTAYADKDKTLDAIKSPNFCMIGESTPERFYEALNEGMIYEGLLPRFTIIEYTGELPALNKTSGFAVPSVELVNRVSSLISMVNARGGSAQGPINVGMDDAAERHFDKFNSYCEGVQRGEGVNELMCGMWSRAHLKAMKLAATIAVGINMQVPTIDEYTAEWACNLVAHDCINILKRFDNGSVGEDARFDMSAQYAAVKKVLKSWLVQQDASALKSFNVNPLMINQGFVPHSPLVMKLSSTYAFKKCGANKGSTISNILRMMLDNDELRQLPQPDAITRFNTAAKCYAVSFPTVFFAGVE